MRAGLPATSSIWVDQPLFLSGGTIFWVQSLEPVPVRLLTISTFLRNLHVRYVIDEGQTLSTIELREHEKISNLVEHHCATSFEVDAAVRNHGNP